MLSGVYEFMALTIFEENLNLSEKFSSSKQPPNCAQEELLFFVKITGIFQHSLRGLFLGKIFLFPAST